MGRRTALILIATIVLTAGAGATAAPPVVATLSPGEAAFWAGPSGEGPHEFRVVVEPGGARIRFLGQTPQPFGSLSGRAVAPDGREVDVTLHVVDGRIEELEVWAATFGGDPRSELPVPGALRPA